MSSFATLEVSRESSRPAEIVTITQGSTSYRYTSAGGSITIGSDIWLPIAMSRTGIKHDPSERSYVLEITVSIDNEFVAQFFAVPPERTATLQVLKIQRDESPAFATRRVLFDGDVQSIKITDDVSVAKICALPDIACLKRSIPRYGFQAQCNHTLFDAQCGVSQVSFQYTQTVSAVGGGGTLITVPGAGSSPFNGTFFRGGFLRATGSFDQRTVISQSGDVLKVSVPFRQSVLNQSVDVFAGCNRIMTGDCATKFDNVANHGGWPYVPNKNVFVTGIV